METLYWHDYETFGRDPARDRLAQFAGIRTDTNLNIIGKPLVKYCKLSNDIIPDPGACLVTGITPQFVNKNGICESKLMQLIHKEFNTDGTCSTGYNSSNFDDEFTRYALYRNFINPYEHHDDKKGNSRWDLINVVRLIRAINPDGAVAWPMKEDGKYSTRLQDLTVANGIEHHDAHDALADVYATINLAKLLRSNFTRLFDYCYKYRTKKMVGNLLGLERKRLKNPQPLLHINSIYGHDAAYSAIVYPICKHPSKGNSVIVYNVLKDPEPLLECGVQEIRDRLFTKGLGDRRISLHEINIGKCPVLIPLNKISHASAKRLSIDKDTCNTRVKQISEKSDVAFVAQTVYRRSFPERTDPELMLYDGFFDRPDKARINQIRESTAKELRKISFDFDDPRLSELLFRYRARNFPSTLTKNEKQRWEDYRQTRINSEDGGNSLNLDQYKKRIFEELAKEGITAKNKKLLKCLQDYEKKLL